MSGLIPEDPGLKLPFRKLQPADLNKVRPVETGAVSKKRRPGSRSWMAELLFEQSVLDEGNQGGADEGGSGGGSGYSGPSRSQLVDGFIGEEPPKNFAQYRALMSQLFDAKREAVVRELVKEPVFATAVAEWSRISTTNANIARSITPFIVKAMEKAYEFKAPPIEFTAAAGFLGLYDMKNHKITLTPQLFGRTLKEFIDTLVHEEVHSLQTDLILLLSVQRKGRVLTPPERAIATYWKNEEPKYRSAMAAGSHMSPETKRRYQMIGQEYHAWTTGHYIASKLTGGR